MTKAIMSLLKSIFEMVENVGTGVLIQSPSSYNSVIYEKIKLIIANVTIPLSYGILVLFAMYTLYEISIKHNGVKNKDALPDLMRVSIATAITMYIVDNTLNILEGIIGISNVLITKISAILTGTNNTKLITNATLEIMETTVNDLSFFEKLSLLNKCTIIYFIVAILTLVIDVIVIGRLFQLYLMFAFAPIPLASLSGGEFSTIGKNFLKSFFAVALQGALIIVIIGMYGLVLTSLISENINTDDMDGSLLGCIKIAVVLVVALFSSGKLSKTICNAM